jgi:hypothetical protein
MSRLSRGNRLEARRLRAEGMTHREIAVLLSAPLGSVAYWVVGVEISEAGRLRLAQQIEKRNRIARQVSAEIKKADRKRRDTEATQAGRLELGDLSARNLLFLFIGLYWGEGYKTSRSAVSISNSDPNAIRFAMRMFRSFGVLDQRFKPWLHLHSLDQKAAAVRHWSEVCELPEEQIRVYFALPSSSKGVRSHRLPNGTMNIVVNDTRLTSRIKGWLSVAADAADSKLVPAEGLLDPRISEK